MDFLIDYVIPAVFMVAFLFIGFGAFGGYSGYED